MSQLDADPVCVTPCIVLIVAMHTTQLRQADLNLLIVFKVLEEERNVSRAARRLLLSQPAATRALGRLRELFQDDLLVRVSGTYELTPKGQLLLQELEATLPRIDRLLTGGDFVPSQETVRFRLAGTDYASLVIGMKLSKYISAAGEELSLDFSPPHDNTLHDLDRGRLDMLLGPDDGQLPKHYERQALFDDEFVCVFDRKAPYGSKITLAEYLEARHIAVSIFEGIQTLPDRRLAENGLKRRVSFTVPYFTMAVQAVAGTSLIATVPKRMAILAGKNIALKFLKAPKPVTAFTYFMWWHPRANTDSAHIWLRNALHKVAEDL